VTSGRATRGGARAGGGGGGGGRRGGGGGGGGGRLDHAVRHFVGHELAAGREGVREPAEFVARLGVGAEDRPRGDGGDAELAGDRLGLGSLARTGGTDEDHSYRH